MSSSPKDKQSWLCSDVCHGQCCCAGGGYSYDAHRRARELGLPLQTTDPRSCSCRSASGCVLPRGERPPICRRYLCISAHVLAPYPQCRWYVVSYKHFGYTRLVCRSSCPQSADCPLVQYMCVKHVLV